MASQELKIRIFRAISAVTLVLTASISVVASGNLSHSRVWWLLFSGFLVLLSIFGYFAAGYESQIFEEIATVFHKWLRDKGESLGWFEAQISRNSSLW